MNVSNLKRLLTLLTVLPLLIYSQTNSLPDIEKLENYLAAIHLSMGFNGEILVAKDDDIHFQKSIGLASFEHNLALNTDAKYHLASITKTFTGMLIALAQEEEKLDVSDRAIKYLDDLDAKFENITILQLMTHTSGIPHNEGIEDYWHIKSKLQMTQEQVISEINGLELVSEPGSKFHYSSLGYFLLSSILENLYQDDFESVLKHKILDKLDMTETGTFANLKIIPQMTSSYHMVADDSLVVAPYRNYSMLSGAGNMYSNTSDLLKWTTSFFSNQLLSETTKADIQHSISQNRQVVKRTYGCGWYLDPKGPPKQFHGGGTWGYSTYLAIYPKERISIIILSNLSRLPISDIASGLEKIVFGLPFDIPRIENEDQSPVVNLNKYCGKFFSVSSKKLLTVKLVGDLLFAQLEGSPAFQIYAKGVDRFFGKKIEIDLTFLQQDDLVIGLKAERMGKTFEFKKELK